MLNAIEYCKKTETIALIYLFKEPFFLEGTCEGSVLANLPNASFNSSGIYPGNTYDIGAVRLNTIANGRFIGFYKSYKADAYQYFQVMLFLCVSLFIMDCRK